MFIVHFAEHKSCTLVYRRILVVFCCSRNTLFRNIFYVYLYLLPRIICFCIRLWLICSTGLFLTFKLHPFQSSAHALVAALIALFADLHPQNHSVIFVATPIPAYQVIFLLPMLRRMMVRTMRSVQQAFPVAVVSRFPLIDCVSTYAETVCCFCDSVSF